MAYKMKGFSGMMMGTIGNADANTNMSKYAKSYDSKTNTYK